MKIPTEILTRNKIRDAAILRLYAHDNLTMQEIGLRFGITGSRCQQIIYKNRHLLKIDKDYEKIKRLSVLNRLLTKHPESIGNKSTLDIVDQLRVETEGNKIEHSGEIKTGETRIILITPKERETVGNRTHSIAI